MAGDPLTIHKYHSVCVFRDWVGKKRYSTNKKRAKNYSGNVEDIRENRDVCSLCFKQSFPHVLSILMMGQPAILFHWQSIESILST